MSGPVETWKGVTIKKMGRGMLEQEFITLATAERDRNAAAALPAPPSKPTLPLPPLDPHTSRCLRELREITHKIEMGEFGLLRFSDETVDANGIHRNLSFTAQLIPPRAKP